MASRVTNIQLTNNFIREIFDQRAALETARQQVSSGIKVRDPSDDPGRAGTIAEFKYTLQRIERHKQRIALGENMLSIQDSVLEQTESILLRAKELAAQGANGTNSTEIRQTMAEEVWNLRDSLVSLANTKVQGIFLYGGAADDNPPFTFQTGVTGYTEPLITDDPNANKRTVAATNDGQNVTRNIRITDLDTIKINTPGADVFANAIYAVESLGRSLAGYETTVDGSGVPTGAGASYSGDYAAQTQDILAALDNIETARAGDVSIERSSVGSRMNSINQSKEILETLKINAEQSRSILQDVDIFKAASDLTNLQSSLEALLSSGANIQSLSLLNFI